MSRIRSSSLGVACVLLGTLAGGCAAWPLEAEAPPPEDTAAVADSLGPPARAEDAPPLVRTLELDTPEARSNWSRPLAPELESRLEGLFLPGPAAAEPPAAAALGVPAPCAVHDPGTGAVFLRDDASTTPRGRVQAFLAVARALAWRVLSGERPRRGAAGGSSGEDLDRAEARFALACGWAWAALLDRTRSTVSLEDPDRRSLRRIDRFTDELLADPTAAPARLLGRDDLTLAERVALEEVAGATGPARRLAVLRVFAATRLWLQARDRFGPQAGRILAEDPPRTTAEILRPERFFAGASRRARVGAKVREGLLGPDRSHAATARVGEWGLRAAVAPALGERRAASVAARLVADRLTLFAAAEGEAVPFAWSLAFADRLAARYAESAFAQALSRRTGAPAEGAADGSLRFSDRSGRAAAVWRRGSRLAVVAGAPGDLVPRALGRLLDEPLIESGGGRAPRQDRVFRLLRALASPIVFESFHRFDREVYAFWGGLLGWRRGERGDRWWLFHPGLPGVRAEATTPPLDRGLLLDVDADPGRRRGEVLGGLLAREEERSRGRHRVTAAVVSHRVAPRYEEWEALGGLLGARRRGLGIEETSTPLFYRRDCAATGARERAAPLDLFRLARRDGGGRVFTLLPGGLLVRGARSEAGRGARLDLALGLVTLARQEVVPGAPRTRIELGFGLLFAWDRDRAAGAFRVSVGRIGGRSLLGFGSIGPRGARPGGTFLDLLYLRFGSGEP